MLAGIAFLNRNSDAHIAEQVRRYHLSELPSVRCGGCDTIYRLFARPSNPRDEEDAKSDIRDLTQRADSIIYHDCPSNISEGQPRKQGHISQYEFLESGQVAV